MICKSFPYSHVLLSFYFGIRWLGVYRHRASEKKKIRFKTISVRFPFFLVALLINNNTQGLGNKLLLPSYVSIILFMIIWMRKKIGNVLLRNLFLMIAVFLRFLCPKTEPKKNTRRKIVYHNQSAIKSKFDCYIITFLWSIRLKSLASVDNLSSSSSMFLSQRGIVDDGEKLRLLIIEANRFYYSLGWKSFAELSMNCVSCEWIRIWFSAPHSCGIPPLLDSHGMNQLDVIVTIEVVYNLNVEFTAWPFWLLSTIFIIGVVSSLSVATHNCFETARIYNFVKSICGYRWNGMKTKQRPSRRYSKVLLIKNVIKNWKFIKIKIFSKFSSRFHRNSFKKSKFLSPILKPKSHQMRVKKLAEA